MSQLVYKARFERDGVYQFDAVMFHGTVGVFTGFKDGAFSVSSNSRLLYAESDWTADQLAFRRFIAMFNAQYAKYIAGVLENLGNLLIGRRSHTWLMRETLEQCSDYECAKKQLSMTHICSLVYYIVAGVNPNEGVSITRGRTGPEYFEFLDADNGQWYIA